VISLKKINLKSDSKVDNSDVSKVKLEYLWLDGYKPT
jgi:hypothetical protein